MKRRRKPIYIQITLTSEEARVFREEYERKIRENEERLETGDVEDVGKLMEETDKLIEELAIFNAWNP
jgi:hypothetical protein